MRTLRNFAMVLAFSAVVFDLVFPKSAAAYYMQNANCTIDGSSGYGSADFSELEGESCAYDATWMCTSYCQACSSNFTWGSATWCEDEPEYNSMTMSCECQS